MGNRAPVRRSVSSRHQQRQMQRRAVYEGVPVPAGDEGGPACPQDPAHGRLSGWTSGRADYYCSSTSHDGLPFYRRGLAGAAVWP